MPPSFPKQPVHREKMPLFKSKPVIIYPRRINYGNPSLPQMRGGILRYIPLLPLLRRGGRHQARPAPAQAGRTQAGKASKRQRRRRRNHAAADVRHHLMRGGVCRLRGRCGRRGGHPGRSARPSPRRQSDGAAGAPQFRWSDPGAAGTQ